MPYKSKYNKDIAEHVRFLSQNHVNREKEINDCATIYEIPSQVESSVLRHPEVHGGSGFAASTIADLGFEPTLSATSSNAKPTRRRTVKIEVGEGLSAAGVFGWWRFRLVEFRLAARSAHDVRKGKGCLVAPC